MTILQTNIFIHVAFLTLSADAFFSFPHCLESSDVTLLIKELFRLLSKLLLLLLVLADKFFSVFT